MRNLTTAYSMYFNKRYDRIGHLFQGVYKGVHVGTDEHLLYLSRYIHTNPSERGSLSEYPWSSYSHYLENDSPVWLETQTIKSYFSRSNPNLDYKNFVEDESVSVDLKGLTLE